MAKTTLQILDEVNIRFLDLDVATRRKMVEALEFFVPNAKFTPAFRLGRWNGKISFCDIGSRSYINLLDKLLPIVQSQGYEIEIEDNRISEHTFEFEEVEEDSYAYISWPAGHPMAGQPIMIREHQATMINSYLNNTQSISIIPTGGGKTLITGILSHKIQEYGRSIIIVPSKDLVTQTEEDYINLGLDVGVFYGDRKEYGKTHTICTWQSLESLSKKSKDTNLDIDIDDFVDGVVCVIIDEVHRAKGDVLKKLLTGVFANVPVRWGLTGTLPENDYDKVSLLASIGPVVDEIHTKELQDRGILAGIHIHVRQYQDLGEVFGNYQAELKWLMSNSIRLRAIAKDLVAISETGNTLILVDRIEAGEKLQEYIPNSVFLSGNVKSKDRKVEYDEVKEVNNKVIIATYGIASTGTNIPRIFNLVLVEPGKSFVRVIQSIGRGLRVTPDKDFVNVYDITSNSKYSKRHLTKRKGFYKEKGYEYNVVKVNY